MTGIIPPTTAEEQFRAWEKRIESMERNLGVLAFDKVYPSAQRPAALGLAGRRIFDYDQGRPLWSDGTQWVDALGRPADNVDGTATLSGEGGLGAVTSYNIPTV